MASTSIDLSKLPAPSIVEVPDYETLLSDLVAKFKASWPEFSAHVESEPMLMLFEAYAADKLLLLQRFNDVALQCRLPWATGTNLDTLAAFFGVERLTIAEATEDTDAVYESDADLRARVVLAQTAISTAGSKESYKFWALKVAAVKGVSVLSPNPGDVLVTVMGRTGSGTVDSTVTDAVAAQINDEDVRPLTDHVTVQSVTPVNFTIAATIYVKDGPDGAVVYQNALDSLDAYLATTQVIGQDIPMSGLYKALHADGVARVELTAPTSTIVVDNVSVGYCTAKTITNGGVSE